MRKALCLFLVMAFLAAAVPAMAGQFGVSVTLAPSGRAFAPPALGRKQGWLTITNRDWFDYTLNVDHGSEKLFLYRQGQGWGSVHIPSGTTISLALNKNTWDLYGNTNGRLKVRIREGRTTTLSLEPFGFVGNTGLVGIANDGNNVRRETLFEVMSAPVVIAPAPPTVIVQQPPPPPVIIHRPPPVVVAPPPVVVVPPRRPPPPRRGGGGSGWGFSMFFN